MLKRSSPAEAPNFFASTKFFSCLDWKASKQLHEASQTIRLGPQDLLFEAGDDSSSGIYIVLEGQLGSYLQLGEQLLHTNTLCQGESVGDLDVLDGELDPQATSSVHMQSTLPDARVKMLRGYLSKGQVFLRRQGQAWY